MTKSGLTVGFRRDKDIPKLISRMPNTIGYMGSDVLLEVAEGVKGPIAVAVIGRLAARFAVGARQEEASEMSQRLKDGEDLRWVTSNPKQLMAYAERNGFRIGELFCVGGSVEAVLGDIPDFDVVLDIVDTGGSMRRSKLEIIQDNVASIALIGICQKSVVSQK